MKVPVEDAVSAVSSWRPAGTSNFLFQYVLWLMNIDSGTSVMSGSADEAGVQNTPAIPLRD